MLDTTKYRFIKDVILDDLYTVGPAGNRIQQGYKPNKRTIQELTRLLPDCKVVGFHHYYMTMWCLEVADPSFEELGFVTITTLKNMPQGRGFIRLLP